MKPVKKIQDYYSKPVRFFQDGSLELEENHFAWGIACVGLQMWDEQFGHNFTWNDQPISYKQQYYDITKQIKDRQ